MFNDLAFAFQPDDHTTASCLAPTSRFKPLVEIVFDEARSKYIVVENPEEITKLNWKDSRENIAFLFLSELIGQALYLGLSNRGTGKLIEQCFKKTFSWEEVKYLKSIYRWNRLRKSADGAFCLPYFRQSDNETQILKYYKKDQKPDGVSIPMKRAWVVLEDPLEGEDKDSPKRKHQEETSPPAAAAPGQALPEKSAPGTLEPVISGDKERAYIFDMPANPVYNPGADVPVMFAAFNSWGDELARKEGDIDRLVPEVAEAIALFIDTYQKKYGKAAAAVISYITTPIEIEESDKEHAWVVLMERAIKRARQIAKDRGLDINIIGNGTLQGDAAWREKTYKSKVHVGQVPEGFPPKIFIFSNFHSLEIAKDTIVFLKEKQASSTPDHGLVEKYTTKLEQAARNKNARVVIPEPLNPDVLRAVAIFLNKGIGKVVLLGDSKEIEAVVNKENINLDLKDDRLSIIDPRAEVIDASTGDVKEEWIEEWARSFCRAKGLRDHKITDADVRMARVNIKIAIKHIREELADPIKEGKVRLKGPEEVFYGAWMVASGKAGCMVAGKEYDSKYTISAINRLIGTIDGVDKVSAGELYATPYKDIGTNGAFILADITTNECPNEECLADIAVGAAMNVKSLIGPQVKMAFVFDKNGKSEKVTKAVELARAALGEDCIIDGPMGMDEALAGGYNAIINPDLSAANPEYKLLQWICDFKALSLTTGGARFSVHDLSRGSTPPEIETTMEVACACITDRFAEAQKTLAEALGKPERDVTSLIKTYGSKLDRSVGEGFKGKTEKHEIPLPAQNAKVVHYQLPFGANFTVIGYREDGSKAKAGKLKYTLIDTGIGIYSEDVINMLKADGIEPKDIEQILITHFDMDHAACAGWLQSKFAHIKVYAHESWPRTVRNRGSKQPACAAFNRLFRMLYDYKEPRVIPYKRPQGSVLMRIGDERDYMDLPVIGEVQCSGLKLSVLESDGHTPDSVFIVAPENGLVISGELIQPKEKVKFRQRDKWHLSLAVNLHPKGETDMDPQAVNEQNRAFLKDSRFKIWLAGHGAPAIEPDATPPDASSANEELTRKARRVKELFGEKVIADKLDLDYDFQQFVEKFRRERFLEGNEGGSEILMWYPQLLWLMPIITCNASCSDCMFGCSAEQKGEMSMEDIRRVFRMDDIFNQCPLAHIFGGEPLIMQDLIRTVEEFQIYSISTNASTMTSPDVAKSFIEGLRDAFNRRQASQMGHSALAAKDPSGFDAYQRSWAQSSWGRERLENYAGGYFELAIALDDLHLEQKAISVEKIANTVEAAVKYWPELRVAFITLKGKWKDRALPALQKELASRGLDLALSGDGRKFVLAGKDGSQKVIGLMENEMVRTGRAIDKPAEDCRKVNREEYQEASFGYYRDTLGYANVSYRGDVTTEEAFLAEHAPLVFGNALNENWSDILRRLDKDPLFRALTNVARYEGPGDVNLGTVLRICDEYEPGIVDNILNGRPGAIKVLFYWLLSNPERKLYATYRLLSDCYDRRVLIGKNPFDGMTNDEIKTLVQKQVGKMREDFKMEKGAATPAAPAAGGAADKAKTVMTVSRGELNELKEAAVRVVEEAHGRGIRTIISMPGSGILAARFLKRTWDLRYPQDKVDLVYYSEAAEEENRKIAGHQSPYFLFDDYAVTGATLQAAVEDLSDEYKIKQDVYVGALFMLETEESFLPKNPLIFGKRTPLGMGPFWFLFREYHINENPPMDIYYFLNSHPGILNEDLTGQEVERVLSETFPAFLDSLADEAVRGVRSEKDATVCLPAAAAPPALPPTPGGLAAWPLSGEEQQSCPDRDMKGDNAPDSDIVVRTLISKDYNIIEIEYDGKALKAWHVKDLKGEYHVGITPEEEYRGDPVNIDLLLTRAEQENLIEWISSHTLSPPERGVRDTDSVRFRISLNQAALQWTSDIGHSNISHAGYHDRCVYIGAELLELILRDRREGLRKDILDDDEYWHLIDAKNKDHVKDKAYYLRMKRVEEAIAELHPEEALPAAEEIARHAASPLPGVISDNAVALQNLDLNNATLIGEGRYGRVFLVRHKATGKDYAVKVYCSEEAKFSEKDNLDLIGYQMRLCREHRGLIKKGLMPYYYAKGECYLDEGRISETVAGDRAYAYTIMDYIPGRSLEKILEKKGDADSRRILKDRVALALAIAEAASEYHREGLVVKELKPANIVVRPDNSVCIIDQEGVVPAGYDWIGNEAAIPRRVRSIRTARYAKHDTPFVDIEPFASEEAKRLLVPEWDVYSFGVVLAEILDPYLISAASEDPEAPGNRESAAFIARSVDINIRDNAHKVSHGQEAGMRLLSFMKLAAFKIAKECIAEDDNGVYRDMDGIIRDLEKCIAIIDERAAVVQKIIGIINDPKSPRNWLYRVCEHLMDGLEDEELRDVAKKAGLSIGETVDAMAMLINLGIAETVKDEDKTKYRITASCPPWELIKPIIMDLSANPAAAETKYAAEKIRNIIHVREVYATPSSSGRIVTVASPLTHTRLTLSPSSFARNEPLRHVIAGKIGEGQKGKTALSVGIGPGILERELRRRWRLKITGVDVSRPMLAIARENGDGRISLKLASGEYLPFDDDSFDIVILPESIGHMELSRALAEARRVLKPGGIIHITTIGPTGTDWPGSGYKPYGVDEILSAMKRCGFKDAEPLFLHDAKINDYLYIKAEKPLVSVSSSAASDVNIEKAERSARDFVDDLKLRAIEAQDHHQAIILGLEGLEDGWLKGLSRPEPIIRELERLQTYLKKRGLDNVIFVKGDGDKVAEEIQGLCKAGNIPLSNIIVIGSKSILDEESKFNELKAKTLKESALLVAIDPVNLKAGSAIMLVDMCRVAGMLRDGKPISAGDKKLIGITPVEGFEGVYIFKPTASYDIDEFGRAEKIQARTIRTQA